MMDKARQKGEPIFIDITTPELLGKKADTRHFGLISTIDYWSAEDIFNIGYHTTDADGDTVSKDWRWRAPTPAMFDAAFTLRKRNGVLTFMRRERENDDD